MKSLYILPALIALPMSALAESSFTRVKPFVGYNISVANTSYLKLKDSTGTRSETDSFGVNDNNTGDFILGLEIDDVMAISINPLISSVKTKGEIPTTWNEINAEFDVFLNQNSKFKPFLSFHGGYAYINNDLLKTSGVIFGFGLGIKQYINDNVYFSTNVNYNISTGMDVKKINGVHVDDGSLRMSGFYWNIGAGYRF